MTESWSGDIWRKFNVMADEVKNGIDSGNFRQFPDEFIKYFLPNHMRIFSYTLTLVPNYVDAEDIMQEASSIMWRKFSEFEPGSDFVAWGNRIVYFLVLDYRRKKSRKGIKYDDSVFEKIVSIADKQVGKNDRKVEALSDCMKKMSERDRVLLRLRYYENLKPNKIASRIGMTIQTVYKSLARAQGRLALCVKRSMKLGEVLE